MNLLLFHASRLDLTPDVSHSYNMTLQRTQSTVHHIGVHVR